MAVWQTIGKVRMNPRGEYSDSTIYEVLDVVSNSAYSKLYIAKQDTPAGTSLDNTTYWQKLIDLGDGVATMSEFKDYLGL